MGQPQQQKKIASTNKQTDKQINNKTKQANKNLTIDFIVGDLQEPQRTPSPVVPCSSTCFQLEVQSGISFQSSNSWSLDLPILTTHRCETIYRWSLCHQILLMEDDDWEALKDRETRLRGLPSTCHHWRKNSAKR